MPRLLCSTGQNPKGQVPEHFAIITGNHQLKVWATDTGIQIPINHQDLTLKGATCIAISSNRRKIVGGKLTTVPGYIAIGLVSGKIYLISLITGQLEKILDQHLPPAARSHTSVKRATMVRDLIWSKDGSRLFSVAQQHIFSWDMNKFGSQLFSPLNVFQQGGALSEAFVSSSHCQYDPEETFQCIQLNHNEDKIVIGTNGTIYVFDMNLQTIVAKYIGLLGKVTSLSVGSAVNSYEQQCYHDLVQKSFQNENNNNDNMKQFTEFFISCSTNTDRNVNIYQYPPTPSSVDSSTIMTLQSTTRNFTVSTKPAYICSSPDTVLNIRLSILYDSLPLSLLTNQITSANASTIPNITPLLISQRPWLMLSVSTTQGQGLLFSLPAIEQQKTVTNKKKTTVIDIDTIKAPQPQVIIHDSTITTLTNSSFFSATKDRTTNLRHANKTGHSKDKSKATAAILPMHRNGAVYEVIVLNMAQVVLVRNSSILPTVEILTLSKDQSIINSVKNVDLLQKHAITSTHSGETQKKIINHSLHSISNRFAAAVKAWSPVLGLQPLQSAANASVKQLMEQDQILANAVKQVENKTQVLVASGQHSSLAKIHLHHSDRIDRDELDGIMSEGILDKTKLQSIKRQRLLAHTSHLNTTLRELLQHQQFELEQKNDVLREGLANPLSYHSEQQQGQSLHSALQTSLQGTLCGILLQGIQSKNDTTIEQVLRMGCEGLTNQHAWTNLTDILNNPAALSRLNAKQFNKEEDHEEDQVLKAKQQIFEQSQIISTTGGNNLFNEKAFSSGATLINTVKLLPQTMIVQFIQILTSKLQSHPLRAPLLLPWLHVVLRLHSAYLLSVPEIGEKLNTVSNLLQQRCSSMNSIVQLKGRLEVILTQFSNSTALKRGQQGSDDENPFLPLSVFVESKDPIDGDDSFSMGTNLKKRLHPDLKALGLPNTDDNQDDEQEDLDFDDDSLLFDGEGEVFEGENLFDGDYDMDDDDDFDLDGDDI